MKSIILYLVITAFLFVYNIGANEVSVAERGNQFYKFDDFNTTNDLNENNIEDNTNNKSILKELLKVAKEQRDIQKKIYELLSEEINPTPQKVVINGKECIANSSADCFVMPLTKDAKRIPVLKKMLVNPTPETAKDYLQWQAKYLSTGPFKVGRSFQYAMNTYGEEAYPMNITRTGLNTNTNELKGKREEYRQKLLNKMYVDKTLGLYIFLSAKALDYFSATEISDIIINVKPKETVTLIFKSEKEKKDFIESTEVIKNAKNFQGIKILVNEKSFKNNNIYMTPTYMAVSNIKDSIKKQAVAIGRVSQDSLNSKIYEWLEQEDIIKRGGLSDYKVWNDTDGDK